METHHVTIPIQVCTPDELPEADQALIARAKAATQTAYAPYSHFHVGAAIRLTTGDIVAGSNQENAAFSPSLCAERTTMNWAAANYPGIPFEAIAIAAWRESDGAFLDHPISPCGVCRQSLIESEQRYHRSIRVLLYGSKQVFVLRSIADLLPLHFTGEDL